MRHIVAVAVILALIAAASAQQFPMVPYTSIPGPTVPGLYGPMVPNTASGGAPPSGCASTGVLDLSNSCNDIYILTGMF